MTLSWLIEWFIERRGEYEGEEGERELGGEGVMEGVEA
jgi:hypothetical protein